MLDATTWTSNVIIAKVPSLNVGADASVHFIAVRADGASSQSYDPAAVNSTVASN